MMLARWLAVIVVGVLVGPAGWLERTGLAGVDCGGRLVPGGHDRGGVSTQMAVGEVAV